MPTKGFNRVLVRKQITELLSDGGARGPGFNSQLWQGCLFAFLFCCCCVLRFFCPKAIVMKFCNSFCTVTSFSIINILQTLWPIIRVSRYRLSIFQYNLLTAIASCVATLISASSKDHVTIEYHVMCLVFCMCSTLYSVQYGENLLS